MAKGDSLDTAARDLKVGRTVVLLVKPLAGHKVYGMYLRMLDRASMAYCLTMLHGACRVAPTRTSGMPRAQLAMPITMPAAKFASKWDIHRWGSFCNGFEALVLWHALLVLLCIEHKTNGAANVHKRSV